MKKKEKMRETECPELKVCGVPIIRGYRGEEFFIDKFCQGKNEGWQKCAHFQDRLRDRLQDRQKNSPSPKEEFGAIWLRVACRR